eukprot:scpid101869/ scgid6747/ 
MPALTVQYSQPETTVGWADHGLFGIKRVSTEKGYFLDLPVHCVFQVLRPDNTFPRSGSTVMDNRLTAAQVFIRAFNFKKAAQLEQNGPGLLLQISCMDVQYRWKVLSPMTLCIRIDKPEISH